MHRVHPGSRTRHVGILAGLALIVCFWRGVASETVIYVLLGVCVGSWFLYKFLQWWSD